MGTSDRIDLLSRIARAARHAKKGGEEARSPLAILGLSAASFGARPADEATIPTGFDPVAVSLFEAIVEGAYLVASADGIFEERERRTFERVVLAACGGAVAPAQIAALINDFGEMLEEEGLERRIDILTSFVRRTAHKQELLRVASLLAMAREDVSERERAVLERLALGLGLDRQAVEDALGDAARVLAG